jgi:hypothetical protein
VIILIPINEENWNILSNPRSIISYTGNEMLIAVDVMQIIVFAGFFETTTFG